MKVLAILTLLAASAVSAFAPMTATTVTKASSELYMSASSIGPNKKSSDGFTGRPGYVAKSMEPVADKQVSKLQRMTMKDVMIEPNYFLTWAVTLLCPLIIWYHPCKCPIILFCIYDS